MPCFLNREIISLLSTLGVKDEVLLAMQHDQLDLLGRMLTDSKAALEVLESLNGADSKSILVKMLHEFNEPNSEPYLSMMLKAYYAYQLSDLKSRCRIFVPKGRVLVGCLDETGLLNYGQVFVRITVAKTRENFGDENLRKVDGDDNTCIIVGKVVVTKNPCLHPGDIRVLDAIYSEELEEKGLRDCLVFPQKGHRYVYNELHLQSHLIAIATIFLFNIELLHLLHLSLVLCGVIDYHESFLITCQQKKEMQTVG